MGRARRMGLTSPSYWRRSRRATTRQPQRSQELASGSASSSLPVSKVGLPSVTMMQKDPGLFDLKQFRDDAAVGLRCDTLLIRRDDGEQAANSPAGRALCHTLEHQ